MLESQNNLCGICNKQETRSDGRGGVTALSIDHCHTTGKVRGLLCSACNTILGQSNDQIAVLEKAIEYLKQQQLAMNAGGKQ